MCFWGKNATLAKRSVNPVSPSKQMNKTIWNAWMFYTHHYYSQAIAKNTSHFPNMISK